MIAKPIIKLIKTGEINKPNHMSEKVNKAKGFMISKSPSKYHLVINYGSTITLLLPSL